MFKPATYLEEKCICGKYTINGMGPFCPGHLNHVLLFQFWAGMENSKFMQVLKRFVGRPALQIFMPIEFKTWMGSNCYSGLPTGSFAPFFPHSSNINVFTRNNFEFLNLKGLSHKNKGGYCYISIKICLQGLLLSSIKF